VSVVDFTVEVKGQTTKEAVNAALKTASETTLKGVLGFTTEPLVSCDFNGDVRSSIIDSELTMVLGGNMIKIITWYDNESGFSNRMLDVTEYLASKGI
jgi:glyceraldehyde 3-phosphate dehydrogenase